MENLLTEEQVITIVRGIIEKHTYLEKEGTEYFGEIYVDYRDSLSDHTIEAITSANNMQEAFYEFLHEIEQDSSDYDWVEVCRTVKDQWDEEEYGEHTEYEDTIDDFLRDNVHFHLPTEHYLKQDVFVNIIVDSGDGNYDFTLNNLANYYSEGEDTEIEEESSLLWLAKQQGYTKEDLEAAIKSYYNDGDSASPLIHSLITESANTTTPMNALSFFVKMSLGEYIEMVDSKKDIVLSASTSAGLYDPWNGAGGCLEIQLEKDVVIPHGFMEPHVDGAVGYGIDNIYGMSSSFWSETVKGFI